MKLRMFLITAALILATQIIWRYEPKKEVPASAESTWLLPSEGDARQTLNSTERHREWVSLPLGAASVRVFVAYPGRMDTAPGLPPDVGAAWSMMNPAWPERIVSGQAEASVKNGRKGPLWQGRLA